MKYFSNVSRRFAAWATIAVTCSLVVLPTTSEAGEFTHGDLTISNPQAAPTVPGLSAGGVFFDAITNSNDAPDRLIGASSPVAKVVEVHRMVMQDNVMRMRAVDGVDIVKGQAVSFQRGQPDSYHVMLMELEHPLTEGKPFPVTLKFEKAGEIEIEVNVMQGAGATMSHGKKGHGKMDHGHMKH